MSDLNKPSPIPRGKSAGEDRGALYVLCFECLPAYRSAPVQSGDNSYRGLDLKKIASEINVSYQKVSNWFKNNSLPGQRVNQLIALKGSRLTYDKLGPFISSR